MKEITNWTTVTAWHNNNRIGEVILPKEEAMILELVNSEGHVFRWDEGIHKWQGSEELKPPYTPTKWVYGTVFLEECHNPTLDKYARKLLGLTEESVVFEA